MILQQTHTLLEQHLNHAIFAPWPQAEIISHYVLWLHDVEKYIEEEKYNIEGNQFLITLTLKHKKVLQLQGAHYNVPHNS